MKQLITALALLFAIGILHIQCKNKPSKDNAVGAYVNYDKWLLDEVWRRPMTGHPKEISYSFSGTDTNKITSRQVYRFDNDGNMIYHHVIPVDTTSNALTYLYRYDENGRQQTTINYNRADTTSIRDKYDMLFRRRSDGVYEMIMNSSNPPFTFTYYKDGKKEERRPMMDGRVEVLVWQHENGKLKSLTSYLVDANGKAGEPSKNIYHYSSKGFLDSIAHADGGVTTFQNNEQGDPVYMYSVSIEDQFITEAIYDFTYDEKGNWIRKRVKVLEYPGTVKANIDSIGSKGKYLLVKREIKY